MQPSPLIRAASAYFAAVFALGFVLGALRVLVLQPQLGALAAVALELPVMLAASWWVCRRVLERWPVAPAAAPRLAMGALAFGLLMAAELALSVTVFGGRAADFGAALATPAGALGLAGQICFALIPWMQGRQDLARRA